jgi:hypothetical protein
MVEFGTAVELDGEQIVPTQVGDMSLQVPLSDVEELAMGVVGARIDDAIVPSATRPGCFSISLNAVGLTRVVVRTCTRNNYLSNVPVTATGAQRIDAHLRH